MYLYRNQHHVLVLFVSCAGLDLFLSDGRLSLAPVKIASYRNREQGMVG